jgi:hypothetical protein
VHAEERRGLVRQYPEEQGQYLVPDIDQIRSVDAALQKAGATELQRYTVICDVMSRFIRLTNR